MDRPDRRRRRPLRAPLADDPGQFMQIPLLEDRFFLEPRQLLLQLRDHV